MGASMSCSAVELTYSAPMRVKVLHIWNVTLPSKLGHILSFNVLFIDEEVFFRTVIAAGHITVTFFATANAPLESHGDYEGLLPYRNYKTYRYASANFSIDLTDSTIILLYEGPGISIEVEELLFCSLDPLTMRMQTNKDLIYALGVVVAVSYPNQDSLSSKKKNPTKNIAGGESYVILWSPFYARFKDRYVLEKSKTDPILIAMAEMSVQSFNGDPRMLINEEIPVFDEYKDKFEQVDVTMVDGDSASGDDSSSGNDFDFPMLSYDSDPDTPRFCVTKVEEQEHGI
ncbi:hypothetical protein ACFE04_012428 [Oxalis oulophora]